MSNAAWESLSNQAIAAAGIVYFLALLAHLAEWAAMRQPATARVREAVPAGVGGAEAPGTAVPDEGAGGPDRSSRVEFLGRLGLLLTVIACAAHFVGLVGRGMAADPNRVPWGNMYEFTISGSFVVTALYLVLYKRLKLAWMAPLVITFVLSVLMVAVIWLHEPVAPLAESLNSYWLVIHVVSAVIATGAFTLGGIASIMYLVRMRAERKAGGAELTGWMGRVPELPALDRVAYRVHAFAFPVWTFAVLITGPIWAHEAWSRYWNWDPKEVWAFITWVVYAGYLHARATAGWKGRNAAILALVGLGTLWFNFIGINYFSTSSQHSYAGESPAPVIAPAVPGGTVPTDG
ncbi:c-type cytochrome biogenesis protein CcsB [Nocardioides sp. GY 10113]|uniref:c-type cytochrome biogenesis protein CcsB n=1 Tax=Nocardioides sp. GY 10113 TaxID=2569761 RepID=UPI0010A7D2B6|nr:c-type cytochrome biogenesis protein CcsB [Nocardioides sp. GY 10113]TIC89261.1 c-type cytochrome biogenesis protein CcsB [Nocardioides sp. GY 10113]